MTPRPPLISKKHTRRPASIGLPRPPVSTRLASEAWNDTVEHLALDSQVDEIDAADLVSQFVELLAGASQ